MRFSSPSKKRRDEGEDMKDEDEEEDEEDREIVKKRNWDGFVQNRGKGRWDIRFITSPGFSLQV